MPLHLYRFILFCLFLLTSAVAGAQSCTGSLGDPVRDINFSNGLDGGTTTYTYTNGTPADGAYTINSSTNGMHPDTWWQKTKPASEGKYMIINASNDPGTFYTNTVQHLCPSTKYEFAAYVLNLIKVFDSAVKKPNITFSVKVGSLPAQTYNTGDIPVSSDGSFTKYAISFTTPAAESDVVITMTNNAPGGNGNDLLLSEITFRACGPSLTPSFTTATVQQQINACEGGNQSFPLTTTVDGAYGNPYYQWQRYDGTQWVNIAGANSPNYTVNLFPAVAGTYQYRLGSAEMANKDSPTCWVFSKEVTITVYPHPVAAPTASSPVCAGGTLQLGVNTGGSYQWTGPNGFTSTQQSPSIQNVTPAASGTYNVTVTTNGCSTTASVNVIVQPKVIATAGNEVTICKGSSTMLNAGGGVQYSWVPAAGLSDPNVANPVASPGVTTTYTVTVSNSAGCSSTASVTVNVADEPTANAGADRKIVQGQMVQLNGAATNFTSFHWTPTDYLDNPNSLTPVATPPADITYTLHVLPLTPCAVEATDDVFIRVYKKITVPNTFTPNNDGTNDTWVINALDTYPESVTEVFNRYGKRVFQSTGYTRAWDGTFNGANLPEGTYYYKIDLKNGTVLSGWVLLLR